MARRHLGGRRRGRRPPKTLPSFARSPPAGTPFEPRPLQPWTIRTTLKRRLKAAGLPDIITPHSFRAMVVTDLLSQGVSTEHVQYLVGHARPTTTQLYDRRAGADILRLVRLGSHAELGLGL